MLLFHYRNQLWALYSPIRACQLFKPWWVYQHRLMHLACLDGGHVKQSPGLPKSVVTRWALKRTPGRRDRRFLSPTPYFWSFQRLTGRAHPLLSSPQHHPERRLLSTTVVPFASIKRHTGSIWLCNMISHSWQAQITLLPIRVLLTFQNVTLELCWYGLYRKRDFQMGLRWVSLTKL